MKNGIYSKINELLLSGLKLVLARTIRRSGSTPRDIGAMCIITEDKKLFGTIGGGPMEYYVQKRAMELLDQEQSLIYKFRLSDNDIAGNGMICGGDVDIYLETLSPDNADHISIFKAVQENIDDKKTGTLVTLIKDGIHSSDTGARFFINNKGVMLGAIPGIDIKEINLNEDIEYNLIPLKENGLDLFVEKIGFEPELIIFGAGHVSKFLAQLAKIVGFRIMIIDDRPEFANSQRFPDADDIIVSDFQQVFERIDVSLNSYIVILTRGHLYDKVVLSHALGTKASYIGMIGSIKKRNTIYQALMNEGFDRGELEKIHSPVGLDINAETPEEIAVSIIGELIKKKHTGGRSSQIIL